MGEYAACGKALRAMRGDGVAMVELAEFCRVECDDAGGFAVHLQGYPTVFHANHGSKITIGDTEVFVLSSELDAISRGELTLDLPEDIDSLQPARIIGDD